MNHGEAGTALLERLRREFDQSFARPSREDAEDWVELLAFRLGSGKYATRLAQIAAVQPRRALTRVPGSRAGFDGLTAVHGQLVAVYDLGVLTAAPGPATARRWLLLCREERQLAFAVDAIDGYMRVARSRLVEAGCADPRGALVSQALDDGGSPRLLVDVTHAIRELRRALCSEGGGDAR